MMKSEISPTLQMTRVKSPSSVVVFYVEASILKIPFIRENFHSYRITRASSNPLDCNDIAINLCT